MGLFQDGFGYFLKLEHRICQKIDYGSIWNVVFHFSAAKAWNDIAVNINMYRWLASNKVSNTSENLLWIWDLLEDKHYT